MIEALILVVTGVAALSLQMVYFLLDEREPQHTAYDRRLKKRWHCAGGAIHIWMGYAMGKLFGYQFGLLMASSTWYFFDGLINTLVLHREWWYIGTTAWLDIIQARAGKWINIDPRLLSALLKNLLLITSIVLVCLKK